MRVLSQSKPTTHDLFCERCVNKPNPVSYKTHMSTLFSIEFINSIESQFELIEFMNTANTEAEIVFIVFKCTYCKPNFNEIEKRHK